MENIGLRRVDVFSNFWVIARIGLVDTPRKGDRPPLAILQGKDNPTMETIHQTMASFIENPWLQHFIMIKARFRQVLNQQLRIIRR